MNILQTESRPFLLIKEYTPMPPFLSLHARLLEGGRDTLNRGQVSLRDQNFAVQEGEVEKGWRRSVLRSRTCWTTARGSGMRKARSKGTVYNRHQSKTKARKQCGAI